MAFSENPPLPSTDWDILISGSGTLQSLLAVALGRAGKTVLQIDRNPYYGGSSTAFYSAADITAWVKSVNDGNEVGFSNAVVEGGLGKGCTVSLAPELVYWHSGLLKLLRSADMTDSFSWQAVGSWWVCVSDEDAGVPAASGTDSAAVSAGVKAARVVAGAKKKWNKGRKKEEGVEAGEGQVGEPAEGATTLRRIGDFREVPCTFEDVAWSRDLTDRDRGYLGEFLRFVMKHDSSDPADQKYHDIFQANRTNSLHSFLSTTYPLPPSAITSLSSLTLLPSPPSSIPLEAALPKLSTHFTSLGNIPDIRSAAALTIAYGGSSELCQVFSRAAAVAGGVNVLGRGVKSIRKPTAETNRRHEVELDNAEVINVDWIIGEAEELHLQGDEQRVKVAETAKAAFVVEGELKGVFERKYRDEVITPAAGVVMVPSGEEGGRPVYVLARSAVTGECPRGQCLLYASTTDPGGYEAIKTAVDRFLGSQEEQPKVLFELRYTVTSYRPSGRERGEGIVELDPVGAGVVFDDGVVERARGIWEGVVGAGTEGFMKLPEEARRLMDEMED